MTHHPFGPVPSVPGLVDPKEVDVPVEVGLQVPRRHPREAPKVALEPRTQVVRHFYPLQVDRVVDVHPMRLAVETSLPDQHAVRPLGVVDARRPGRHPAPMAFLKRAELGFPWP